MKETQASIYQWARATFGEAKSILQVALRAREELDEMIAAIVEGAPPSKIVLEAADTVIVLSQIPERLGLDLGEAIDRKMAVNRARVWKTAGDGTGQHIEEFPGCVAHPQAGVFACSPEDAGRKL